MISRYRNSLFIFLIGVVAIAGYDIRQAKAQDVKSQFKNIEPGPYNPPVHPKAIKEVKKKPISVVPPDGGGPLVRLLKEGNLLKGEHFYKGKVFALSHNIFRFEPESGTEIMIGFVLPNDFKLKKIDGAEASLYVNDNSSLVGADQTTNILTKHGVLLGSIWKVSKEPIIYSPTNGVIISQISLSNKPSGDKMETVDVLVNTDEGKKNVPTGKTVSFTVGGRRFAVFLHTSIFQSSSDKGDDTPIAYILRAVIAEN